MRRDKFDKYDRNNDGFLSFPEFWKLVQDHTIFTRSLEIDTESLNRYPNLDKETARMIFNRADKNGDKFLSYKEMHDKWPQMRRDKFDKYDRNNDGFLSFPEFWKLVQDHTRPTRSLEIDTESLYKTRRLNNIDLRKLFNEIDTDNDGRLTFEECHNMWPEQADIKAFEKADLDYDGFLTFDEFKKGIKEHLP